MKSSKLVKLSLVAVVAFSLASALTTRGITITDLVETPDSLSFNFSGSGSSDSIKNSLPVLTLTYWKATLEVRALNTLTTYGFSIDFMHLPDGSIATVGDSKSNTPFGTTLSDTETIAHGTGLDTYNLSITVQRNPIPGGDSIDWGDFSGTFSASHAPTGVPDAGSTGMMAGFALVLLAVARMRYGVATSGGV